MLKFIRLFAFCLLFLAGLMIQSQAARAQELETLARTPLPLSNVSPSDYGIAKPLTYPQRVARFAEEQRMLRMEFNKSIGHSPLRPNMSAGFTFGGYQSYYIPSRAVFVTAGPQRGWYW